MRKNLLLIVLVLTFSLSVNLQCAEVRDIYSSNVDTVALLECTMIVTAISPQGTPIVKRIRWCGTGWVYKSIPFKNKDGKDRFYAIMCTSYHVVNFSQVWAALISSAEEIGFNLTGIKCSSSILVSFKDGKRYLLKHNNVKIEHNGRDYDFAALHFVTKDALKTVKMGISEDLMIGDEITSIGFPLGHEYTCVTGRLSNIDREIRLDGVLHGQQAIIKDALLVDMAMAPGSSGSPVFNVNGEVIGIADAIHTSRSGWEPGFVTRVDRALKTTLTPDRLVEVGALTSSEK